MPAARDSSAAMACTCSTIFGSHDEAIASGAGKNGVVAVDHVETEENRDVQTRLLDGNVLQPVDLLRLGNP